MATPRARPQNEKSPDHLLDRIGSETESFIAALTDGSPHVRRVTVGVETETDRLRYRWEYVSGPPRPDAAPDRSPEGAPDRTPDGTRGARSGLILIRPDDDRLTQHVIRYVNERRVNEHPQFFHMTEVYARLSAYQEEDPSGFGLKLPGDRAVREVLEKLRERGDLARSVYAKSTRHHFHGTQDCVRIGTDGPEYASPDVAPPAELLVGVEGVRPVFDYVRGWSG